MILVRDIFQLKFGKARDAMNLWNEMLPLMSGSGHTPDRLLTDLTGQYYTLIMESTFENLAEYEMAFSDTVVSDEWRKSYMKFTELVDSGRREIFTIVPVGERERVESRATAKVGAAK